MRINTILVTLALLSGCATQQQEVRVEKLPEPPQISVPDLALNRLTRDSTTDEVISAYYEAVVRLQGALDEAIAALNAYRGR